MTRPVPLLPPPADFILPSPVQLRAAARSPLRGGVCRPGLALAQRLVQLGDLCAQRGHVGAEGGGALGGQQLGQLVTALLQTQHGRLAARQLADRRLQRHTERASADRAPDCGRGSVSLDRRHAALPAPHLAQCVNTGGLSEHPDYTDAQLTE